MERLTFFQRLRGFFMMDWEKKQQPKDAAPGRGGDPQAVYQNERARVRDGTDTRVTDKFSRDLTRMAAAGMLDPLVGRDQEVGRVIQILARRTKNNILIQSAQAMLAQANQVPQGVLQLLQ